MVLAIPDRKAPEGAAGGAEPFTDQVLDHFSHPRNVGALAHPDAVGTFGDPACGDFLELHLEIRGNVITDARFRVRGCVAAIATSSMTTVLIKGKTLEEASRVTDRAIAEALGGLPPRKLHCSILGATAVKNAVADYRTRCERGPGMKKQASGRSCLQPTPRVLVSCRDREGRDNALAVAYCCNCSYDPPMVMVGIVPSRFSHPIIKETGCFVVNLVPKACAPTFFELGKRSGRDGDKLAALCVKTENGVKVNAPLLSDCPVNIECTVVDSIRTGSHEMFVGRVEYVHADPALVDEDGTIDFSRLDLL